MKTLLLFLLPLAGLCASPALHAQTVVNLKPSADTYVSQTNPSTPYGDSDVLSIRHTSSSNRRLSYLKFDLGAGLSGPVSAASLSLSFAYHTGPNRTDATIEVYGLAFDYAPDPGQQPYDWSESLLTNQNAPWSATTQTAPSFMTLLGTFTVPGGAGPAGGTVLTLSSTPALVSFLESVRANENSSLVTFVLRETVGQTSATNFYSADYANSALHPLLSITTAIPEPSNAVALFGIAALALAAARRSPRRG